MGLHLSSHEKVFYENVQHGHSVRVVGTMLLVREIRGMGRWTQAIGRLPDRHARDAKMLQRAVDHGL